LLTLPGEVHASAAADADDDREQRGERQRGAVNATS
jgi:hypothetical protein